MTKENKDNRFEWIKDRIEFFTVLTLGIVAVWTIKNDIHSLDQRLTDKINGLDTRLSCIETTLTIKGYTGKSLSILNNQEEK